MAREVLPIVGAAVGGFFGGAAGAQWGYAIGSLVGNAVDPAVYKGPSIGDNTVQTSRDGVPIPVMWGVVGGIAGNIIQMNPLVRSTVKSGSKKEGITESEKVTRTFAIGIGRGPTGPITGLLRVWENNKLIYDAREGSSFPAIDNAAFLAGTNIYLGDEDQLPDSELESYTGVGSTPAYRGLPYIVFINKDLTSFAAAIPQYKFEITATSGTAAATAGAYATQYEYVESTPNLVNPFASMSADGFTIRCVARATTMPTNLDQVTFDISQGGGTSFNIKKSPLFDQWYWEATISDQIGAYKIASDVCQITTGHTGWNWWDQYDLIMSYSNTLNECYLVVVNHSVGEEHVQAVPITNRVNVGWTDEATSNGSADSLVTWGCGEASGGGLNSLFNGYLSQVLIHDKYIDLSVEANRRLFSKLTGMIDLQDARQIFGEQPLVYQPYGSPSLNIGSLFIGNFPADFVYHTSETPATPIYDEDSFQIPTVGEITTDLAGFVNVTDIDTLAIDFTQIRGFMVAGLYSAADTIRSLQRGYFYDLPEIDGELVAVLRGGDSAATILQSDMVVGQEANFDNERQQAVEFPRKLHVAYTCSETDYTATKETSERRSADIKSISEMTVEIPANLAPDEMAQIADKLHKVMWAEAEGSVKFSVSEKFAYLTPSDPVTVELSSGVMKRLRIEKVTFVDGMISIEAFVDRESAYTSSVSAPAMIDPPTPVSNYPSATTFEIMDIPVIRQAEDTLHVYIAAHGDANTAWVGAVVEQYVNDEWVAKGTITIPSSMGQVEEAFADADAGLDESNELLVSLSDDEIASISQSAFDNGGNLALVGSEVINFKTVTAESGNYRLSYITRGMLETETNAHAIGERFVLLGNAKAVQLDSSFLFQPVTVRVYSINTLPASTDEDEFYFSGQSQVEFSPLVPTMELSGTDWIFSWAHNKRIGAPASSIISTHFTKFVVRLIDGSTQVDLETTDLTITYTAAEQTADFGSTVSAFDTVHIFGINEFTGEGHIATPADISGDHLLLENSLDSLLIEDESGTLLLE